jgi:phage terminase large subunit-like protein
MPFDFACPDWVDRLKDGRTPIADLPLDDAEAERAVGIFNMLRLPDVFGQPTLAEAAGEWMRDIVRAIFGSMQTSADGYTSRQVGEAFVLVPKKNAKTTSAAAIGLTFMLMNKRRNADMLIIGPTQKISDVAFEQAKGMIDADPFLQKRFHVQDHKKTIRCRVTNARLMIRTFGMDVLTGAKPIFALLDEIHLLGSIAYAADVIRQIRGGMLPFPESLFMMITTQSDHAPAGAFKTELDYARGVRDGKITERVRTLPVLYEFPVEIQSHPDRIWMRPDLWHMVTPNLGRSISIDALTDAFERAKQDGLQELISWATQHLNVQIGVALHGDRWAGADYWASSKRAALNLTTILAECDVAVAGIDGGGLDDLMAMAVIGRHRATRQWLIWVRAWAQADVFERRKEIAPRLRDFIAQGDLIECKEVAQDATEIAAICAELQAAGLLPEKGGIGLDPYGVAAVTDALAEAGIPDDVLAGIGQGYKLQPAIQTLPRRLKDKTAVHADQPMMDWVVGNAKAELRGSNIMVTKQAAGSAKIDPLMALFNATILMLANPEAAGRSEVKLSFA